MAISRQQLAAIEDRLKGRRAKASSGAVSGSGNALKNGVLLGVDPSLRGTGFGILAVTNSTPSSLEHGTIRCPASWPQSRCLAQIAATIRDVIKKHAPTICVIEGLFFAQNIQTALIMGQARGAAMAVIAEAGLEIYELAPRKVKQAIVGHGGAQKDAVAKMVQRQLALAEQPDHDAADALALALAFVQTQTRYALSAPKRI
jgi:crossover junction endodeoxyribonuclease RuvC